MMRLIPFLAVALLFSVEAPARRHTDAELRREIALTPEKSGGIYYAYPTLSDESADAPAGFQPFAIVHYGRHGSRWAINEKQYDIVDSVFFAQSSNLTPLGKDIAARIARVGDHARGHSGELSPVGERQHRAIASRLIDRYPSLFADTMTVTALSSLEPRCIQSMAAFCERLKEVNPALRIRRSVAPAYMKNLIAGSSPEAAALGRKDAPWRAPFLLFRDSVTASHHFMASLFADPSLVTDHDFFMRTVHDIAIDLQDVELSENLFHIFTPEELYGLWLAKNYDMYSRHAYAAVNRGTGPSSAAPLLMHLIGVADETVQSGKPGVTLHFGHDTNLIRLLALMGIKGCADTESDPLRYNEAWQDFRVSPMGANLQLIFFRNDSGDIIVLPRHNEKLTSFPIPSFRNTPFYSWPELRSFLRSRLPSE